jgi:signal transduction histidine kinase
LRGHRPRQLTFRYVSALLSIAGLLAAGQLLVQCALDRQEGDARVINLAGRQRMLSQRLCMLMLAGGDPGALARVADEWQASQQALSSARDNSDDIDALFEQIAGDHRAMLAGARRAIAGGGDRDADARLAVAHQDAFLAGMDHIVATYEREARDRVIRLRRIELALLSLALVVLALEGLFVFRPAVRALRQHLADRDQVERQLLEVADRDQKRIAQVIHDGVGQHLVGVSSLVKTLRQRAATGGDTAAREARLDEIDRLLAEAVDQTRSLARGLHSHTLEMAGLVEALRELAVRTEKIFGITCRVDAGDVAEPPLDVLVHLHNIAREAVANAAKHAQASLIEVSLVEIAGELRLTVRDDGVGIAPQAGPGMGLQMMQHRAKMIGASLQVGAGEAKGTVVSCTLPAGDHA